MENNRRDFLKKAGLLTAGTGMLATTKVFAGEEAFNNMTKEEKKAMESGKPFKLSILQTTDVHCQIHPHDEMFWEDGKKVFRTTGGYANIATYIEKARKENPLTFVFDGGDMFQGSELSVRTTGDALLPILNSIGYDLYLPGNWEVVYYKKAMQHLLGSLHAPKVCANLYHDLGNGKKGELVFPPYYIWNVAGVKIGFLGYTDHLVPKRQSPNYSEGTIYTKPEENMAHYVDVLKNQEKCAAVFIVAHIGLSQQISISNMPECEGVDYILGADTHERVRKPIQGKYAKVVEPGAFGSFVGKLDLTIHNGKVIKDEYELVEITSSKYKPNKKVAEIIKEVEKPHLDKINEVVGYSTIPLYRYFVIENTIDTMIIDALKWKMPEVDIVLSNGFRFCPPRSTPDHTGNIPITSGYIFDMLPVDSVVRAAEVTGQQILDWLEKELNNVFAKNASERFGGWVVKFKGMQVEFRAFDEMGKRVEKLTIAGQPLDKNKTYKISACERDGDPDDMLCRIPNVKNGRNTPFTLHSVMKDYLKNNSPVTPTPRVDAKVLDAPQTLLTQVSGVDYDFR
jgi:S-sulfosulfanyl-L-cysteine sulfohydrolase